QHPPGPSFLSPTSSTRVPRQTLGVCRGTPGSLGPGAGLGGRGGPVGYCWEPEVPPVLVVLRMRKATNTSAPTAITATTAMIVMATGPPPPSSVVSSAAVSPASAGSSAASISSSGASSGSSGAAASTASSVTEKEMLSWIGCPSEETTRQSIEYSPASSRGVRSTSTSFPSKVGSPSAYVVSPSGPAITAALPA